MNYLRANSRPGKRRSRALIATIISVIVILGLIQAVFPHAFPGLFTSIARPFWRTEFSITSGALRSPEALLAENESLKRDATAASAELANAQALQDENTDLKALLGRASTTPYILAAVLKRPPAAAYDEVIIDIGKDFGLSTTSTIYAPGNILIGRVTDVLAHSAKATLFSSPGERYDVFIGPSHAPSVAVGKGGGQYEAELPRAVMVSQGDAVVESSLNDKAFGVVTAVLTDPAQPFETILFAPPVNIYELRWVLVDVRGK